MTATAQATAGPRSVRALAAGAATLVVALAWLQASQSWATTSGPPRYDMFEPFLRMWGGLTWTSQLELWFALAIRPWPWIPLVVLGLAAVAIQAWIGVGSAWIGIRDGDVSGLGALMGALSIGQLGLTLLWIVLIARSKRMQS